MSPIRMRVAVGVVFMLLALTGCVSSPFNADNGEITSEGQAMVVLEWEQLNAQYLEHSGTLRLPSGASFPALVKPPPSTLPDGTKADDVYEGDAGIYQAETTWLCAWEREWLDATGVGDSERQKEALSVIESFSATQTFEDTYAPETQQAFDNLVVSAGLGDVAVIARDVELNCGG